MGPNRQSPWTRNENKGPGCIAFAAIMTTLSLVFVSVRFYVRTRIVRAIGWDDWVILLSVVRDSPPAVIGIFPDVIDRLLL